MADPDSPKQLKDRFRDWDVKKYISNQDMEIMLSLKIQHSAVDKDVKFEYRGHPIEPERLNRALKRRKSFLEPGFGIFYDVSAIGSP